MQKPGLSHCAASCSGRNSTRQWPVNYPFIYSASAPGLTKHNSNLSQITDVKLGNTAGMYAETSSAEVIFTLPLVVVCNFTKRLNKVLKKKRKIMKDYLKNLYFLKYKIIYATAYIGESLLQQQNALLTAQEIAGQPELWNSIYKTFDNAACEIKDFYRQLMQEADNIILTGAGTSAFIGLSYRRYFFSGTHKL